MKSVIAFVAAFAAAASAAGVSAIITPTGAAPAGCTASASGSYFLSVVKAGSAGKAKRAPPLEITLADGVLTDSSGRTGYIASNFQFQFDGPPQAGAIYTAGWSLCSNESLALGPTTTFYECFSGSFGNLYNKNIGAQCQPVNLDLLPASGTTPSAPASSMAVSPPPATSSAPAPVSPSSVPAVTQSPDGQPQATTAVPAPSSTPAATQISDGQVQATTAVSAYTGGAPVATMAAQLFAVAAGAAALAL